jgi:hypothetical protein
MSEGEFWEDGLWANLSAACQFVRATAVSGSKKRLQHQRQPAPFPRQPALPPAFLT